MNEHALLHLMDSQWSFPLSKNELIIRFRASRFDDLVVKLVYGPKFTYHLYREEKYLEKKYEDELYSYFEIKLKLEDTRLAYIFKIIEKNKIYYFSEDGLSEKYNFDEAFYNYFQMPYINEVDVMPYVDWMKEAVFYQIFIDRFNRGNFNKDDDYINTKWGDKPSPKSFTGGDLQGITDKLEYLKSLGINAIYLTPIFKSPSNHKYDIVDFYEIDPNFGDKNTLRELVDKAHKLEIRIVLDAVFNHISDKNPLFLDVVEKGKDSTYYDWFYIDGDYIDKDKVNYQNFSIVDYMPKLNTSNYSVQDYLIKVGKYWIEEFGIDGWRLDVSDEVSHDFWRKFRKEIKRVKKDAVLIGENWHDAASYLQGDQFDSIMNYSFTKASLDYFKNKISANAMAYRLNHLLMRNKEQVNRMNLNLLDTHDTHRIFTELDKNKDKVLAAIALMTIYLGAPCLYYGTEIFLEGGYDPDSRRNFDWDKLNEEETSIEIIKDIFKIKKLETIQEGDVKIYNKDNILIIKRFYKNQEIHLYINLSEPVAIDIGKSSILVSNKYKNDILWENGFLIVSKQV